VKNFLVLFLLFFFSLPALANETGWLRFQKNGIIYFRPFITLKTKSKNVKVFFFTPDGKVYKGRRLKHSQVVTPTKKFPDNSIEVIYTVIKLSPPFSLEIIKEGKINQSNVRER